MSWARILAFIVVLSTASFAVDGSFLKPPAGASVALVVFEDLECPACAQAMPMLEQAARTYKLPLVIHDVPLRIHPWAWDAAMLARYIEQRYGRAMSDPFRDYIYQHQPEITKANLRSYADKFAAEHHIELPFMLDPQGKIADAIKADQDLGQRAQLTQTPTIFVVSTKSWAEVPDYRTQIDSTIDKIKRDVPAAPAPRPAAKKK